MPARGAHDINRRVRHAECRQALMLASARSHQHRQGSDRGRCLHNWFARTLRALAVRVGLSTPIGSQSRQPRNAT